MLDGHASVILSGAPPWAQVVGGAQSKDPAPRVQTWKARGAHR